MNTMTDMGEQLDVKLLLTTLMALKKLTDTYNEEEPKRSRVLN